MLTVNWGDNAERQRTNLQRRKISAAIKLERLNNNHDAESCKQEVIEQLEEELQNSEKELKALELSLETRRRREIETLKRFGVDDSCINYGVPDIRIQQASSDPSIPNTIDIRSDEDESSPPLSDKKITWTTLHGLLSVTPLFRRRIGSARESSRSRRYRAMSADVLAIPSETVQSLSVFYTGTSYFAEEKPPQPSASAEDSKPDDKEQKPESPESVTPDHKINPKALQEIAAFEKIIKNFFKSKQQQPFIR